VQNHENRVEKQTNEEKLSNVLPLEEEERLAQRVLQQVSLSGFDE